MCSWSTSPGPWARALTSSPRPRATGSSPRTRQSACVLSSGCPGDRRWRACSGSLGSRPSKLPTSGGGCGSNSSRSRAGSWLTCRGCTAHCCGSPRARCSPTRTRRMTWPIRCGCPATRPPSRYSSSLNPSTRWTLRVTATSLCSPPMGRRSGRCRGRMRRRHWWPTSSRGWSVTLAERSSSRPTSAATAGVRSRSGGCSRISGRAATGHTTCSRSWSSATATSGNWWMGSSVSPHCS